MQSVVCGDRDRLRMLSEHRREALDSTCLSQGDFLEVFFWKSDRSLRIPDSYRTAGGNEVMREGRAFQVNNCVRAQKYKGFRKEELW